MGIRDIGMTAAVALGMGGASGALAQDAGATNDAVLRALQNQTGFTDHGGINRANQVENIIIDGSECEERFRHSETAEDLKGQTIYGHIVEKCFPLIRQLNTHSINDEEKAEIIAKLIPTLFAFASANPDIYARFKEDIKAIAFNRLDQYTPNEGEKYTQIEGYDLADEHLYNLAFYLKKIGMTQEQLEIYVGFLN